MVSVDRSVTDVRRGRRVDVDFHNDSANVFQSGRIFSSSFEPSPGVDSDVELF